MQTLREFIEKQVSITDEEWELLNTSIKAKSLQEK